jgi:hypothetical protein
MSSITIVIMGVGSTLSERGYLPTGEDFEFAHQFTTEKNFELKIIVNDPKLIYALRGVQGKLAPENENVVYDTDIIKGYNPKYVGVSDDHQYTSQAIPRTSPNPVIYVDFSTPKSTFEMMSSVMDYNTSDRYFLSVSSQISIREIAEKFYQNQLPIPFNLYEGKQMPETLTLNDRIEALTQMHFGCQIMIHYITAQYHHGKYEVSIPGWCMNPETPLIKGLINTYGLVSPVIDQTAILQMTTNSGYRRQLCEIMARVIASFAVINGLIDINSVQDWYSTSTYAVVAQNIGTLLPKLLGSKDEEKE